MRRPFVLIAALSALAAPAFAQERADMTGLPIPDYGTFYEVDGVEPFPAKAKYKVSFDVTRGAAEGEASRALQTSVRLLNMSAAAGVPSKNMKIAVVVHGGAVKDVAQPKEPGATNPSADLVAQMIENGIEIYVCGQAAAAQGVATPDLLPGVKMSPSATVAHAILHNQGYNTNPF